MGFIEDDPIEASSRVKLAKERPKWTAHRLVHRNKEKRCSQILMARTLGVLDGKAEISFFTTSDHVTLEGDQRYNHHGHGCTGQTSREEKCETLPTPRGEDPNDFGMSGDDRVNKRSLLGAAKGRS